MEEKEGIIWKIALTTAKTTTTTTTTTAELLSKVK
jgi:hypothetical protein